MKHIVLLRGLAREAAHWLDFPARLQQHLGADCHIHLVDFPGCGRYFTQPALASVSAMTEHARREIDALNIDAQSTPLFVMGISMGGMIALDWAQRFPQEVRGLVLINSSTGAQPFWWRLRPGAWLSTVCALFASTRAREAGVLALVSNKDDAHALHLRQWLAIQQQRPVSRATIVTMLRAAARFQPQPECSAAGLILASKRDRMVSVRASEAIAKAFGWPIFTHETAGHDLPIDDSEWVIRQIDNWLIKAASNQCKNTV